MHEAVQVRVCVPQLPQAREPIWPGEHTPSEVQEPYVAGHWHAEVHVRVSVPQLPHPRELVVPGMQTPSPPQPLQPPHEHDEVQVRVSVPHIPHARVSVWPGVQTPPAVHAPKSSQAQRSLHVRERAEQAPEHASELVSPGAHSPSPAQALGEPHTHDAVQVVVRVPQRPQPVISVAPGVQVPSPVHAVGSPQSHASVHVRICVPQLPHATVSDSPGVQSATASHSPYSPHAPHLQLASHVRARSCEPQEPQAFRSVSIAPGAHSQGPASRPRTSHRWLTHSVPGGH